MIQIPDEFLLAEEREGFLIPASVKQAWAAQLEVLMEIDRVCKKHKIQYFADWGTFLGTVRHGGYIPWDDDLDIVMKREDYRKFMDVARWDMEDGFHVQTYENQDDFWLFMGKVVGRNRMCFEKNHLQRFHNFPYIACVDIFVLDYMYRDPQKEENRRRVCKYILGVADSIVEGSLKGEEKECALCRIEQMSGLKIERMTDPIACGRYLYSQVEQLFAMVPEEEADYLTQLFPWGLLGNGRMYPKQYYEKQIWLPFEFLYMPVPVAFDSMLRKRYGEYWRVVKGAGAHTYPFFETQKENLQAVMDFRLPEFTFQSVMLKNQKMIYEKSGLKHLAIKYGNELQSLTKAIVSILSEKLQLDISVLTEKLQLAQQYAIELGTMIEQAKGEGHVAVHALEQYCEVIYQVFALVSSDALQASEIVMAQKDLQQAMQNCLYVIKTQILDRKSVVFLPVHSADWKVMHPLWQQAMNEEDCDVYVMPLTYYYKDYDGSPRKTVCEIEDFPCNIHVLNDESFSKETLQLLYPEQIIITNPYDEWNEAISVSKEYFAAALRDMTQELIYVPPFLLEDFDNTSYCEYHNMKYYVTMPGAIYADRVYVQSEKMREVYVQKLTQFAGTDTREIWEEKVCTRAELYIEEKKQESISANSTSEKEKTILYCVSLGCILEHKELTFTKIKANMEVFRDNPNVRVIWYTYPGAEIENANQYDAVLQEFQKMVVYASGASYIELLHIDTTDSMFYDKLKEIVKQCDAYYGDGSPFVSLFRAAHKPIMIQNYDVR